MGGKPDEGIQSLILDIKIIIKCSESIIPGETNSGNVKQDPL